MRTAKTAGRKAVSEKAPAKINLGLWVGARRADGFHELETIFVRVNLCDEIVVRRAGRGRPTTEEQIRLQIADCRLQNGDCPAGGSPGPGTRNSKLETRRNDLPTGRGNLAVRAARAFLDATGITDSIEIELTKRIPLGAGLGGGSSDTAAVLKGLNGLWGRPLSRAELHYLATKLGSDVPFFLRDSSCLATGRGELLKSVKVPKLNILLHLPGFPVPTPWAYQELDRVRAKAAGIKIRDSGFGIRADPRSPIPDSRLLTGQAFSPMIALARLRAGDYAGFGEKLHNSFEDVVFPLHPGLRKVKARMLASGADAALLSGSGSALFAVVRESRFAGVELALHERKIPFLSLRTI